MRNTYLWLLLVVTLFARCKKLEYTPQSTASRDAVFGSEKGLELYANSFYGILPTARLFTQPIMYQIMVPGGMRNVY